MTTCINQVVAGPGGNTIDLALLSTGVNEEYIKVSVPFKLSTKALSTTSNSWKILPHTRHIPKMLPPTNHLLYNIQGRWHWLVDPIHYHHMQIHMTHNLEMNTIHSTYGTQHPLTTTNSFARTSVHGAPMSNTFSFFFLSSGGWGKIKL